MQVPRSLHPRAACPSTTSIPIWMLLSYEQALVSTGQSEGSASTSRNLSHGWCASMTSIYTYMISSTTPWPLRCSVIHGGSRCRPASCRCVHWQAIHSNMASGAVPLLSQEDSTFCKMVLRRPRFHHILRRPPPLGLFRDFETPASIGACQRCVPFDELPRHR